MKGSSSTSSSVSSDALTVTCLVLMDSHGAVLATRRPEGKQLGGLWEFPGGKVEHGEHPEDALRREILEELELSLGELEALTPVRHEYPFGAIRLLPYLGRVGTQPDIRLVEHSESKWVTTENWSDLDWAPADVPVLKELGSRYSRSFE